jgi:hypothetical protein
MFLLEQTLLGSPDPLAMIVFRVGPNPMPRNSHEVEVEVSGRSPSFEIWDSDRSEVPLSLAGKINAYIS